MKPPTVGPEGGAGDSGAALGDELAPGGVIPPYLSRDWQLMRAQLRLAAAHATAAAEASTLEDVASQLGAASMGLIDADFIRRKLERVRDRAE